MQIHYALDEDKNPYPVSIEKAISLGYFAPNRDDLIRVGKTKIGPYEISTVFLVVNHDHGSGNPVLFETMVFTDDPGLIDDGYEQRRYRTWQEALEGHNDFVAHYSLRV